MWLRDVSRDEADALLKSKHHQPSAGTYTPLRGQWDLITQRMSVHDSVGARFDLRTRGTHRAQWAGFYCVGADW